MDSFKPFPDVWITFMLKFFGSRIGGFIFYHHLTYSIDKDLGNSKTTSTSQWLHMQGHLTVICCASGFILFTNVFFFSYRRVQGDDSDGVVNQSNSQEAGALLTRWDVGQAHADHICRHFLSLCVLVQLAGLGCWGWGWGRETKRAITLLYTRSAISAVIMTVHRTAFCFIIKFYL